jgi:outer membrane immunogenic protein
VNGSGCSSLSIDTCSSAKLKQFGTLRGRVGYAFNSFLLYGTAGLAYTSNSYDVYDLLLAPGAGLMSGSRSTTDFGYVLGAGVEWALTRNWSIKGEYLYTPMRATNVIYTPIGAGNAGNMAIKAESLSLVRVGVNYRF